MRTATNRSQPRFSASTLVRKQAAEALARQYRVVGRSSDSPAAASRRSTLHRSSAATDHGVYVVQLGGGSVNTASGDFVFGMTEAYLIENGEITEPLREGNLIGNGPQVLRDIDALGNDFAMGNPGTCGKDGQGVPVGDGQPTLRVKTMTIGGTAGTVGTRSTT